MPPAQRAAYQRALSVDAKPMGGDPLVGGLASRRNAPCPTLMHQDNMNTPVRPGGVPNGFPGGMSLCPPQGNPPRNLNFELEFNMPNTSSFNNTGTDSLMSA